MGPQDGFGGTNHQKALLTGVATGRRLRRPENGPKIPGQGDPHHRQQDEPKTARYDLNRIVAGAGGVSWAQA